MSEPRRTADGLLTLQDGRNLSYGTFGHPAAAPLIYCHGYPTNRIEYEAIAPAVDEAGVDVHVIVLDRPGYGSSTFQPGRTLLDWPHDVAEAVDQLGIDSFSVLGTSGGAPYAMACAVALPDRVTQLGLVVGVGPADAPGMGDSLILRNVSRFGLARRAQFGLMGYGLSRGRGDQILDNTIANISEVDRSFLDRPENREWFLRMMQEAFTQGGRAASHDGMLYLNSWGFDVAGISAPTHLWYGSRDETVPPQVGEWLAGRIPNSSLVVWSGSGHFTWMNTARAAEAVGSTSGAHPSPPPSGRQRA